MHVMISRRKVKKMSPCKLSILHIIKDRHHKYIHRVPHQSCQNYRNVVSSIAYLSNYQYLIYKDRSQRYIHRLHKQNFQKTPKRSFKRCLLSSFNIKDCYHVSIKFSRLPKCSFKRCLPAYMFPHIKKAA